jgi:hypothetical protein
MSRVGQTYTVQVHLRPRSGQPITKGVISANDPPQAADESSWRRLRDIVARLSGSHRS